MNIPKVILSRKVKKKISTLYNDFRFIFIILVGAEQEDEKKSQGWREWLQFFLSRV